MFLVILVDLAFSLALYDFKRVTLRIILENLGKKRKIQYKVAKRLTRLYNDYYGKNETIESLFDISSLVNIPHNISLEIELKMSEEASSIPLLYDFIDDVLSRRLED
jgi:hypothetical protein